MEFKDCVRLSIKNTLMLPGILKMYQTFQDFRKGLINVNNLLLIFVVSKMALLAELFNFP